MRSDAANATDKSRKSKWYRASDENVREVSWGEVNRSIAYMLFYELTE